MSSADLAFRQFVRLIGLATVIPIVVMPLVQRWHAAEPSLLGIVGMLLFLGGPAHVASTALFYADGEARSFFREHRLRYWIVPGAIIAATLAVFTVATDDQPAVVLVLLFQVWLLWHYQKQNYGILAIFSRVSTDEPVSQWEGWAVRAAAVGGICAAIHALQWGIDVRLGTWAPLRPKSPTMLYFGIGFLGVAFVCLVGAFVTQSALRRLTARSVFLVVSCAWFLPAYIAHVPYAALYPYALGHGLQYLVFMSCMATRPPARERSGRSRRTPGLPALVGFVATLGVALAVTADPQFLDVHGVRALYGLAIGVTMAHFVVDAGIWRMRDAFPRRCMTEAMPFLAPPIDLTQADG